MDPVTLLAEIRETKDLIKDLKRQERSAHRDYRKALRALERGEDKLAGLEYRKLCHEQRKRDLSGKAGPVVSLRQIESKRSNKLVWYRTDEFAGLTRLWFRPVGVPFHSGVIVDIGQNLNPPWVLFGWGKDGKLKARWTLTAEILKEACKQAPGYLSPGILLELGKVNAD